MLEGAACHPQVRIGKSVYQTVGNVIQRGSNKVESYHPRTSTAMSNISRADLHRQVDELSTELLAVVERSSDFLGGLPVFRGTRASSSTSWCRPYERACRATQ